MTVNKVSTFGRFLVFLYYNENISKSFTMKTINLTDDQFEQLKEYVVDSCEDIMDRSLEWADSDLSNEIIDNNEIIFEFRSILEGVA